MNVHCTCTCTMFLHHDFLRGFCKTALHSNRLRNCFWILVRTYVRDLAHAFTEAAATVKQFYIFRFILTAGAWCHGTLVKTTHQRYESLVMNTSLNGSWRLRSTEYLQFSFAFTNLGLTTCMFQLKVQNYACDVWKLLVFACANHSLSCRPIY